MKIFDAHCDVLMKLWMNPHLSFLHNHILHVTFKTLKETGAKVQLFAIYVPESVTYEQRFDVALEMVQLFHTHILSIPNMKLVCTKQDIDYLKEDEIGAVLTLEGCDAIGHNLARLYTLFRLGVSAVGLTWNYSNAAADGILEERGAGLSSFGKQIVQANNEEKVWTDVSHISIKGFWDVIETADYLIASHSNAYSLCPHPRNLRDDQIKAIIQKNGVIGITFVPEFLTERQDATIDDVLRHVDYVCGLGGEHHIGFGSDFDGISETPDGLHNYRGYDELKNRLLKYYSDSQVNNFLFHNFYKRIPK
ncbi:dipeptidase [Bacillus songklensis]|uniref:Dipeptidase n=1 Tax=Bacillus songklensis TaxID=1069116 RepID=A0ABV8AZK9_9BACI